MTTSPARTVVTSQPRIGVQVLVITAFLSLRFLLEANMGSTYTNEIDVLPLAKQYAEPTWIPKDWYVNQPPGYRLLFFALFGKLAATWGFLVTSILGRLVCYGLVSTGLVLIGRCLGLSLLLLLLAVGIFIHATPQQGMIAREWIVGGVEPKAVAYGFVLLAVGLMLQGHYRWMALMVGLATSFHVLVGGWAALSMAGWLALRRRSHFPHLHSLGVLLLIYITAGAFGVKAVLEQVLTPAPPEAVRFTAVYVFLRLPHHLNPLSWSADRWVKPLVYLLMLALSMGVLWRQRLSVRFSQYYPACRGLAELTLIALIPFVIGVAVAPFDGHGKLLQYYPFRLADVLLPLTSCLLFACALEQTFTGKARLGLVLGCLLLLSWKCGLQAIRLREQVLALPQFPSHRQGADPDWKALCAWIRRETPQHALVISPPVEFVNFTWMAERPTIAKFKLFPQTKAGILTWYERLTDLSGDASPWPAIQNRSDNREQIQTQLTTGYNRLTTAQVQNLMSKYGADFFVTRSDHQLDLPIAYRNALYTLYEFPHSLIANKSASALP